MADDGLPDCVKEEVAGGKLVHLYFSSGALGTCGNVSTDRHAPGTFPTRGWKGMALMADRRRRGR